MGRQRVIRWLFVSVGIGLLPIFARWIYAKIHTQSADISTLLVEGDIFLITGILCAEALGHIISERLSGGSTENIAVVISSLAMILIVPVCILCYAILNPNLTSGASSGSLNSDFVVVFSVIVFSAMLVTNSVVRYNLNV